MFRRQPWGSQGMGEGSRVSGLVMIVATINGVPGQGFAEVVDGGEGAPYRAGVLKMRWASAARIQELLHRWERLSYSGPVFADGRWRAEAFPIRVTKLDMDHGASATVHIAQAEQMPAHRRSIIVVRGMLPLG